MSHAPHSRKSCHTYEVADSAVNLGQASVARATFASATTLSSSPLSTFGSEPLT